MSEEKEIELQKCLLCDRVLQPDLEAVNFTTQKWDGHTYYPCTCKEIMTPSLRISIG